MMLTSASCMTVLLLYRTVADHINHLLAGSADDADAESGGGVEEQ